MTGIVYLVGAGPGDPGLLTLRGGELLVIGADLLLDGPFQGDDGHRRPSDEGKQSHEDQDQRELEREPSAKHVGDV